MDENENLTLWDIIHYSWKEVKAPNRITNFGVDNMLLFNNP
jgi:hypothetical protein